MIYLVCSRFKNDYYAVHGEYLFLEPPFCIIRLYHPHSNMQKYQQMPIPPLHFIPEVPSLSLLPPAHFAWSMHPPHRPSPWEITSFRMSCSASQQWRVLVCAGFEFQRCTSVPLERIWLRCRGTVRVCTIGSCVPMNIPSFIDMYFADHTDCSHGCLAEWNVLSMGVCVSQGQDTRMTFKCFLLWDPWRLSHPYHYCVNFWGASWLPTHLSYLKWACWGPVESSSFVCPPPCIYCVYFALSLSNHTFSVTLMFSFFSHIVLCESWALFTMNCPVISEILPKILHYVNLSVLLSSLTFKK